MSCTTETRDSTIDVETTERTALKDMDVDIPSASHGSDEVSTNTATDVVVARPEHSVEVHTAPDDIPHRNERVDTTALTGLRGILAIHIMVFHTLIFSELEIDTLGSVQMSLFFLLSGFTFGIAEASRSYNRGKCCSELCTRGSAARNYWQRRAARTLPLFYLTNLLSVPAMLGGMLFLESATELTVAGILTCLVANTWLVWPLLFNGPSWFVATIWFLYWLFPSIYPRLQGYTTAQKRKWIVIYAWLHFVIAVTLFLAPIFLLSVSAGIAFIIATFWPPTRVCIFIMGLLAGMLRSKGLAISKKRDAWTASQWHRCSDRLAIVLVLLLVIGSIAEWYMDGALFLNFWFQVTLPFWQLLFIVSLTMDGNDDDAQVVKSWTKWVLTSKWALWLGEMSYAVYLVHEPARYYICWIVNGTAQLSVPDCDWGADECQDEIAAYNAERYLVVWAIPVVWVVSMLVAVALNKCVEKPMRRWLRPKNQTATTQKDAAEDKDQTDVIVES